MKITKQRLKEIIKEELSELGMPQDNPPGGRLHFPEDRPEQPPPESWVKGRPPEEEAEEEAITKASLVAELTKRARIWSANATITPAEVKVWMGFSDRLMKLASAGNLAQTSIINPISAAIEKFEDSKDSLEEASAANNGEGQKDEKKRKKSPVPPSKTSRSTVDANRRAKKYADDEAIEADPRKKGAVTAYKKHMAKAKAKRDAGGKT